MNTYKIFHKFNVTNSPNLSVKDAFEVAQDILEDVSSTLRNEWPKQTELRLKDITEDEDGIKTYHFHVLEL